MNTSSLPSLEATRIFPAEGGRQGQAQPTGASRLPQPTGQPAGLPADVANLSGESFPTQPVELLGLLLRLSESLPPATPGASPQAPAMNQPGLPMSQPGLPMSQPGLPMNQPGLSMSLPGQPMSQPAQPMSQPGLLSNPPSLPEILRQALVDPARPETVLGQLARTLQSEHAPGSPPADLLSRLQSAVSARGASTQIPAEVTAFLQRALAALAEEAQLARPAPEPQQGNGGSQRLGRSLPAESQVPLPQAAPGVPVATTTARTARATGQPPAILDPRGEKVMEALTPGALLAQELQHAARPEDAPQSLGGVSRTAQGEPRAAAVPTQHWAGPLPVLLDGRAMPAWLELDWQPGQVDENGRRQGAQSEEAELPAQSLALTIDTERLGRLAFHLAWLPKELVGTIAIERPEIAALAQGELPQLESRLRQSGPERVTMHITGNRAAYGES